MRLFVSSFVVALATLVGAALVPASAASVGVGVTGGSNAVESAPIIEKATYWRHRRYGWRGRHGYCRYGYCGHRRGYRRYGGYYGRRHGYRGHGFTLYFGRGGRHHGYGGW